MMNFVVMTLSFTVAILLASVLAVILFTNKAVLKWYTKKTMKIAMEIAEESTKDLLDE